VTLTKPTLEGCFGFDEGFCASETYPNEAEFESLPSERIGQRLPTEAAVALRVKTLGILVQVGFITWKARSGNRIHDFRV
jgi:hypothetical protein